MVFFKNNLRDVLKSKGMSQLDLYKLTGITPANISAMVNGRLVPYKGWKKRISEALNEPEDKLFPEQEDNAEIATLQKVAERSGENI
jgi:transcriptional regulator with XRE-family HTH domain